MMREGVMDQQKLFTCFLYNGHTIVEALVHDAALEQTLSFYSCSTFPAKHYQSNEKSAAHFCYHSQQYSWKFLQCQMEHKDSVARGSQASQLTLTTSLGAGNVLWLMYIHNHQLLSWDSMDCLGILQHAKKVPKNVGNSEP